MKRSLILFICNILLTVIAFAQGEVAETEKILFKNESSLATSLNSNGFGLNYRYGKRINAFKKWIFESDISIIKHPKEIKIYNPNFESQKRFIFGKLNEAVDLKIGFGRQQEIFSKFDKGSISIRYFYTVGGTLLLLKPIYYEMVDSSNTNYVLNITTYYIGTHKFNSSLHKVDEVIGKAPFKTGMNETTVIPGMYVKCGASFEFSKNDTLIRALEAGICIDVYAAKIPIMAIENNRQVFLSIFISYRWGSILNARKKYNKKKRFFSNDNKDGEVGGNEEKGVIKEEEQTEEY